MRAPLGLLTIICLSACSANVVNPPIENVELRATGVDVLVKRNGEGRFVTSPRSGTPRSGTFQISEAGYDRLLERLSQYQQQAGSTAETSRRFLTSNCPKQTDYITDAGTVSIRWIGPQFDRIFIVDFGCDYKRHAERNEQLKAIFKSLPVPEPVPLA